MYWVKHLDVYFCQLVPLLFPWFNLRFKWCAVTYFEINFSFCLDTPEKCSIVPIFECRPRNWLTRPPASLTVWYSCPASNFKISVAQWPSLQIGEALFAFVREWYAHRANDTSINGTVVQQRPRPSWKCGEAARSTKNALPLLLAAVSKKTFSGSGAHTDCHTRICMPRTSRKNELPPVITIGLAIFCESGIRLGFAERRGLLFREHASRALIGASETHSAKSQAFTVLFRETAAARRGWILMECEIKWKTLWDSWKRK